MTEDEIREAVRAAIARLKAERPLLDFERVHERTTAHRIAVHMEPLFEGWNVDCEYDRDGQVRKMLDRVRECDEQRRTDLVLPDIIVHRRRKRGRDHNLLVVEIKKYDAENACDRRKLELFTEPDGAYAYQLGLHINIERDRFERGRFTGAWYRDGAQLPGTDVL
jgi:hypothetical protein